MVKRMYTVGQFVKKYRVNLRTGADRRLVEENYAQRVIGYIAYEFEDGDDFDTRAFKSINHVFVFYDLDGKPRGYFNGWQDTRHAIRMIEKMQVRRGFDEHELKKMKLLMDL
jgi:hypothetical protein